MKQLARGILIVGSIAQFAICGAQPLPEHWQQHAASSVFTITDPVKCVAPAIRQFSGGQSKVIANQCPFDVSAIICAQSECETTDPYRLVWERQHLIRQGQSAREWVMPGPSVVNVVACRALAGSERFANNYPMASFWQLEMTGGAPTGKCLSVYSGPGKGKLVSWPMLNGAFNSTWTGDALKRSGAKADTKIRVEE